MTRKLLAIRTFVRLAVLFFVSALTSARCHAQDFQIMVTGPWQFVADPNNQDRLFLVGAYGDTHVAGIWSGPDASMDNWRNSKGAPQGNFPLQWSGRDPVSNQYQSYFYTVDFLTGVRQTPQVPDEENSRVYQTLTNMGAKEVSTGTIQSVLTSGGSGSPVQRYVISLPRPDFAQTYSGNLEPAVAEAKVAPANAATSAPARKDNWASYSTWTVLHYGFQDQPPKQMKIQWNGTSKIIPAGNADKRFGISIGLMGAPMCDATSFYPSCTWPNQPQWPNFPKCDTVSGLSFGLAAKLWSLNEASRFPIEKDQYGIQETGNYDYIDCPPASATNPDVLRGQIGIDAGLMTQLSLLEKSGANAKPTASTSRQPRMRAEHNIQQTYANIKADLVKIFDGHVPEDVAHDFSCACEAANQSPGACKLPRSSTPACLSGADSVNALVKALVPYTGGDKGVSDCHAPQIGINGPIPTKQQ